MDVSSNYEEVILQLAKHLGKDRNRRLVFNLIYGRGSKPRSKKQIAEALGIGGQAQVVQNALDELSRHHLIDRIENAGSVKDRSKWLYTKNSVVRANRAKIIKFADNPAAAKKVPTKRRPLIESDLSFVKPASRANVTARRGAPKSSTAVRLKIAILMTNPDGRAPLQTGIEARTIEMAVRSEGDPRAVDVKILAAPTIDTMINMLNSYDPDIIHFSGHGGSGTLLFDNENVGDDGGTVLDFDMVARVIEATRSKPKLLVLVACDTVEGADRFLKSTPIVVAMADSVGDDAATEFSRRFYQSIGARATVHESIQQAKLVMESKGMSDYNLPTLLTSNSELAERPLF